MTWLALLELAGKTLDFLAGVGRFLFSRQQQQIGAIKQKDADIVSTNASLEKQAQAAAAAPTTKQELVDALDKGGF